MVTNQSALADVVTVKPVGAQHGYMPLFDWLALWWRESKSTSRP
jgi:hypothetical protein